MQVFRSLAEVPAGLAPSAVTIGKFDGMHLGHRAVIERLRSVAAERGLSTAVLTFDRNPISVIRPGTEPPPPLASPAQKLEALAALGIDTTLIVAFDRAFSELSAEEFVTRILVEALRARVVLVGSGFRFGASGHGTVDVLRELGSLHGFDVIVMDTVGPTAERSVSSTWVRELLAEGRVAEASQLLGSAPTIRSVVVPGHQRGRELGYPTANLAMGAEGFVPGDGVYAAWLTVDGQRHPAAVSIGDNPTFDGVVGHQVEAYVLGETIDLYGKTVEVAFVEYLRPMHKYPDADALSHQIGEDELHTRAILGLGSLDQEY